MTESFRRIIEKGESQETMNRAAIETRGNKGKKLRANEFGKFAEEMASHEYLLRGYTILERNWNLGKTEIDLILQKDDVIVLAEVKARATDEEDALESVTIDKRRRMVRAADAYLKKLQGAFTYRFDIVACSGSQEKFTLEIVEDAFLATDLF